MQSWKFDSYRYKSYSYAYYYVNLILIYTNDRIILIVLCYIHSTSGVFVITLYFKAYNQKLYILKHRPTIRNAKQLNAGRLKIH